MNGAHSGSAMTLDGPLMPISAAQAASMGVMQLSPPADLWERIRRGYAMPNLDSDLVHDREQWYATRPDYIFRMTERSRKYLFHIVEELERRNMPTELALLPFIESAFNPQAVSSAKAAGMWQFMPATGKHFELKQNAFRDDRRDVLASTRAALDYLQKLHGMFGDWHLALAAYNWGEGSVGRAIAKNKRSGDGTAYTDLSMPMETRFYVPKLQAIKNIVSRPESFNAKLPLIENHPFFQTVTIKNDIDVTLAAKLAEVSLEDFRALNPSATRPVILAAGTPQILLPWDQATIFQNNLQAYTGGRLASWTVWIAPTTMKTAAAALRAGMNEGELRAINNIPPRMMIKAGSTLLVPRSKRIENDVTVQVADNGQIGMSPELLARRTLVIARKSETVSTIAKRYRMTATSVAEWNNKSASSSFRSGEQVVLYLPLKSKAMGRTSGKTLAKASGLGIKHAKRAGAKSVRVAKR
jgi:membrane-bound lytic murein transglycosylase D